MPVGGSVLDTWNSNYTTPVITTTTIYYAESRNTTTGCLSGSRVAVTATVNSLPVIATAVDGSRCGNGTVSLSVTNVPSGCTIDWYSSSSGGTALSTGSASYTTPVLSGTTVYYAESRNTTTGCLSSSRVAVTAAINSNPNQATAVNGSRCGTGTVNIAVTNVPSGCTIDWYSSSSGGTALSTGSTGYTTPVISGTTVYYAESRNTTTGCLSNSRVAVTATVNTLPDLATAVNGSRCGSGTVNVAVTNVPAGCTTDWYSAPAGGSPLQIGNNAYTTPVIVNTTTYYAQSRNTTTGCVSSNRLAVTATVNQDPDAPIAGVITPVCEGGVLQLTAGTISGATYLWAGSGNYTSTEQNPIVSTNASLSESGQYEVRVIKDGCTSQPGLVTVAVGPVYEYITTATVCEGSLYNWRGNNYGTGGIYTESLQSTSGCDSIYRLYLTINPEYQITEDVEIYESYLPYEWEGDQHMTGGVYYKYYQSTGGCDSTMQLNLTVLPDPAARTLSLKLFVEGLCSGMPAGMMRESEDENGPEYGTGIADKIEVSLYTSVFPYTMVYAKDSVMLETDGTAELTDIPFGLQGEYYIVIRHRSSIETWSGQLISFSGTGTVVYDFSMSAGQAYGQNQTAISKGYYAIYSGDLNDDGKVDGSDMAMLDNALTQLLQGYIIEDVTGDGGVDGSDMSIIDNNVTNFVKVKKP
jgi:hypothetical protein